MPQLPKSFIPDEKPKSFVPDTPVNQKEPIYGSSKIDESVNIPPIGLRNPDFGTASNVKFNQDPEEEPVRETVQYKDPRARFGQSIIEAGKEAFESGKHLVRGMSDIGLDVLDTLTGRSTGSTGRIKDLAQSTFQNFNDVMLGTFLPKAEDPYRAERGALGLMSIDPNQVAETYREKGLPSAIGSVLPQIGMAAYGAKGLFKGKVPPSEISPSEIKPPITSGGKGSFKILNAIEEIKNAKSPSTKARLVEYLEQDIKDAHPDIVRQAQEVINDIKTKYPDKFITIPEPRTSLSEFVESMKRSDEAASEIGMSRAEDKVTGIKVENPVINEIITNAKEIGIELSGDPGADLLKLNDLARNNPELTSLRDSYYAAIREGKEPFKSEIQSGRIPNSERRSPNRVGPSVSDIDFINSIKELVGEGTPAQLYEKIKNLPQVPIEMKSRLKSIIQDELTSMRTGESVVPRVNSPLVEPVIKPIKGTGSEFERTMQAKVQGKVPPNESPATGGSSNQPSSSGSGSSDGGPPRISNGDSTVPPNSGGPNQSSLQAIAPSRMKEWWNVTKGLMSVDLPFITSASLRQGRPYFGTKNWFKAYIPSVKSFGSQAAYDMHLKSLTERPIFRDKMYKNSTTGEMESFADRIGFHLSDTKGFGRTEEAIRSNLAERIPLYGKWIKASNRQYTAYINDLKVNAFEDLLNDAVQAGKDPYNNLEFSRSLGKMVQDLTSGRFGVEVGNPLSKLGVGKDRYAFEAGEQMNELLNNVFFSPSLMARSIRFFNPTTYLTQDPMIRKQYLYGLMRTLGTWGTIAGLAKLGGADVSLDPTNSDFGKIRKGNLRYDPGAGFQQALVAGARLAAGKSTSPVNTDFRGEPKVTPFGASGPYSPTAGSVVGNFFYNKLSPSARFAWDLINSSEQKPFSFFDRTAQTVVPLIAQDMMELAQENPELLVAFPVLGPAASSGAVGIQRFGKDVEENKFFGPNNRYLPQNDLVFRGFPWNVKFGNPEDKK